MSDIAGSISAINTSNNQLFTLEDTTKSSISVDGQLANVNMVHISKEDYEQLVVTSSAVSSTLYVVSSDFIDAYGQQISNLAPGIGLSDAVNLEQLNSVENNIYSTLSGNVYDMNQNGAFTRMVIDLVEAFGGTVLNNPFNVSNS